MKKLSTPKKILVVLCACMFAGLAWYLASPLFIDDVVEEDFPVAQNVPAPVVEPEEDDMSEEEFVHKVEGMSPEEVDAMPLEEKEDLMKRMQDIGSSMEDKDVEEEMEQSTQPQLVQSGEFAGTDSFHQGSGVAKVFKLADGARILRFEDFSVTNGPALNVWLVKNSDGNPDSDYVDLGKLKGNKGNQNYSIPAEIDLAEYESVVIRCVPFRISFAIASFTE